MTLLSICANCDAKVYDHYLCEICRLVDAGKNYCPIPEDHWHINCEYCGGRDEFVQDGRFLGLCRECKKLASASVPLLYPIKAELDYIRRMTNDVDTHEALYALRDREYGVWTLSQLAHIEIWSRSSVG